MNKLKEKYIILIRSVAVQSVIWVVLFALNYLLISYYPVTFRPAFHLQTWVVYLAVFYLNLLVLLPFFLFRKKLLVYVLLSIVLVGTGSFISVEIRKSHFTRMEIERPRRFERPPIAPGTESISERPARYSGDTDRTAPRFSSYFHRRTISNTLTAVLLIFSLSLAYGLFERYRENEKTRMETEKEKIQTELNLLKRQVNPHFLFNSLNSIYALANRGSEKTTEAVLRLSDMLRYMIYDSEKSIVPINQEFEGLKSFIELQTLRLTDKTKLNVDIQDDPENFLIEPLLLLPVVENAFKYGTDNLNESDIDIKAVIKDGQLIFSCGNTIISGLRNPKLTESTGIGLKNVKRRLELLYKDNHEFNSEEKEGRYLVEMKIWLKAGNRDTGLPDHG